MLSVSIHKYHARSGSWQNHISMLLICGKNIPKMKELKMKSDLNVLQMKLIITST